ncbi:hypothetical protein KP696_15020 [Nocardia seriolae]|uniref:Uncharacterized protein n=2 Tax=Nocardia seriolae TaxID=37332 RepID=A0A0B8NG25_9NOCA|nr:hypothetical protein NS506_00713 [Nocardia seriolae]MTJ60087.1 hypothetical protein [Nocardia seriolae]MTJ76339.1 hypothetical protein [Nocardia seriolae]MTJ85088.1 hypothetical protein [Nocardia seriolae]MTK29083.1 hypothetical protein [Nocardia seriolae]
MPDRYGGSVPHDSSHAPEPVALSLSVPPRPARGLAEDLVRPVSADAGAEVLDFALDDEAVSEFLVRIVHGDSGFVARVDSGERAVAAIAATVAALIGDDIRAALATPDIAFLTGLKPPAVEAFREVLLAVETADVAAVTAALAVLGG